MPGSAQGLRDWHGAVSITKWRRVRKGLPFYCVGARLAFNRGCCLEVHPLLDCPRRAIDEKK